MTYLLWLTDLITINWADEDLVNTLTWTLNRKLHESLTYSQINLVIDAEVL